MHVRKLLLVLLFTSAWTAAGVAAWLQLERLRDLGILTGLLALAAALFLPNPKNADADDEDLPLAETIPVTEPVPETPTPTAQATEVTDADAFDDLETFELVDTTPTPAVVVAPAPLTTPDPSPRKPLRPELPLEKTAQPEWATVQPHREPIQRPMRHTRVTRGTCSNCDATLTLSTRRPIRATCPRCGRSRVLQH